MSDETTETESTKSDYMLGHGDREWERLTAQHLVWRDTLLDALPPLGIGPGCHVLEVGCGNGVLLRDLATLVGPEGRAVGVERDPTAVMRARQLNAGMPWVEVREGDLFELEPEAGALGFDLVVARWVLAWLPAPERAIGRLVPLLRPGGHLLVQDYDYDAIRVEPPQPGLERLFEVMPKGYAFHGGDAWCAVKLPRLYVEAGLEDLRVEPHCKAGDSQSAVFRWAETFFRQHVGRLVDDGLLSPAERDASLAGWDAAHATPGSIFFSPLVVNVIGRKAGPRSAGRRKAGPR